MQACKLTITTAVDGQETTLARAGQIEISDGKATLTYQEETAQVSISLQKGEAVVERQGDYALTLFLQQGKTLEGKIGLGESSGVVAVKTYHVKYSIERNLFRLALRYDLLFGEGIQKMQLRIRAQIKDREGK